MTERGFGAADLFAGPNKFGSYTTGLQFVGLNETVRDEILKFDFKKHRERLIAKRS